MNKWQVFVHVNSEEGGLLMPCEPEDRTGFWIDLCPYDAARAIWNVEWVRLIQVRRT